jgi:hypothetical protein
MSQIVVAVGADAKRAFTVNANNRTSNFQQTGTSDTLARLPPVALFAISQLRVSPLPVISGVTRLSHHLRLLRLNISDSLWILKDGMTCSSGYEKPKYKLI